MYKAVGGHERRREQMPRLHPHAGVDGEHAAGNRRHAADHHSHQLALGHAFEIRLNDQWCSVWPMNTLAEVQRLSLPLVRITRCITHAIADNLLQHPGGRTSGDHRDQDDGAANGDTQYHGIVVPENRQQSFPFG